MKTDNAANRKSAAPEKTTIRARVTPDEHEAIRRTAKLKLGLNIDEFVRLAVDRELIATAGKPLETLADEAAGRRTKYVQGELF